VGGAFEFRQIVIGQLGASIGYAFIAVLTKDGEQFDEEDPILLQTLEQFLYVPVRLNGNGVFGLWRIA